MPAKSKAQQMAAGIAHSVAKGERPESELRGPSKEMFKSMNDLKIKKFAHTKRKGLPKHVSEGAEAAIDAKVQHFIKTMQNMPGQMGDEWLQSTMQEIEGLAQGQNNPEIQKYYPGWQPADFQKLYNRVMMHFYGGGGMGESRPMTARQMFEGQQQFKTLDDWYNRKTCDVCGKPSLPGRNVCSKACRDEINRSDVGKYLPPLPPGTPTALDAIAGPPGRRSRYWSEGRDDAPKLGLGKTGLKFARMTSKEAFKTDGGTDQKWKTSAKLRTELAGEKPGAKMKSMDKVGKVPRAMKGLGERLTPEQVVDKLLAD